MGHDKWEVRHGLWRDEKQWNNVPSHDVVQSVMKQMRALLSEAREKSLNEFDDVSLEELQSELHKWGNSLGLPSDWVPGAALRSGQVAVDKLEWAVVCKVWRLAVRPQPWGITKQVALYKKGDVRCFTSWRNIMINTQLGLLMERLFWNRVVTYIRRALARYQTGYMHRCEYHAFVFHEVAAFRLHMGVGMVALMGDLVGAFPKSWRELNLVLAALEAQVKGSRLVLLQ